MNVITVIAEPVGEYAIRDIASRCARAKGTPHTWDNILVQARPCDDGQIGHFAVDIDVWDLEETPGRFVRRWRYTGGLPTVQRCGRWYPTRPGNPYLPAITAEVVRRVSRLPRPSWVCDCAASGHTDKPKQHGADPHAKNCVRYAPPEVRR